MNLPAEMAAVAAECLRVPGRSSVWSERLNKYVCSIDPEYQQALAEQFRKPPISLAFKLVFLTAAGGTLLFVIICVATMIVARGEPPPPLEKLITGLFDLAKIGFGAVVGLLGGQTLKA